ncbi:MAG: glycosyltransferase family 39 protein [Chloroflexi bacterium]|nr:glycosyltransferase family 39 protein [Chloroflexota bacterium]
MVILQLTFVLVSLVLLLIVPGYLVSNAIGFSEKGAGKDLLVNFLVSVFISVLLSSWLGLTLAELGLLSLPIHLAVIIAVCLVIAYLVATKGRLSLRLPTLTRWDLAPIGVIVLAILLFWPPSQPIFGTGDAGVHFDAGVNLGRTGSFAFRDSSLTLALENPDLGRLPLGLMTVDIAPGLFVPQFGGLFEVWIALFFQIFGWWTPADALPFLASIGKLRHPLTVPAVFYIAPLFGVLSVVAMYGCGKTIFSRRVGFAAALFLAVSLPQVWYSRVTMSEVFTQFLVLGGLTAYALSLVSHRRLFYFVAGSAFGLTFLARIDAVFIYVPFGLWLLWLIAFRRWRADHAFLFAPLAVLALQAAVQYRLFGADYVRVTTGGLLEAYGSAIIPLAVLAAVVLLAIAFLHSNREIGRRVADSVTEMATRAPFPLAATVLVAALYAYFVRPFQSPPVVLYHELLQQDVVYDNGANLVKLGWYLSPLGIALGVAGMAWALARRLDAQTWLLFSVAAVYGLIFLYNGYVTPHHVFWVRRYLVVLIPSLLLFASALLLEFGRDRWAGRAFTTARLTGCAALLIALAMVTPIAIAAPQYQEATQQMRTFATMMPEGGVAVFEGSEAAKWLTVPLALLHGRTPVILQSDRPDSEKLKETLSKLWNQGKETYYVTQIGTRTIDDRDIEFRPVGRAAFDFLQLEMAFGRLPEKNQRVTFGVDVYRMVPRVERRMSVYPFQLQIGDRDYGYIGAGFYTPDGTSPATYRHTNGAAELELPWNPSGKEVVLSMLVAGPRPSDVPEATTTVYVGGVNVGEFTLPKTYSGSDPFVERELRFPAAAIDQPAGKVTVRLVSTPWIPAKYGLGDLRTLGITLKHIALRDG